MHTRTLLCRGRWVLVLAEFRARSGGWGWDGHARSLLVASSLLYRGSGSISPFSIAKKALPGSRREPDLEEAPAASRYDNHARGHRANSQDGCPEAIHKPAEAGILVTMFRGVHRVVLAALVHPKLLQTPCFCLPLLQFREEAVHMPCAACDQVATVTFSLAHAAG